ncbi:hypothetical protein OEZ85_005844 [Tetradesmus obliquus]|uniref:Uncharacterized protein n=1 Tax=Tetradesmus obliquus TaxID=3088 RepID=A0ABY8UIG8_TETOB|nr:hypothetical protein OEZ85_005844 [Tetradesmus obliquus]
MWQARSLVLCRKDSSSAAHLQKNAWPGFLRTGLFCLLQTTSRRRQTVYGHPSVTPGKQQRLLQYAAGPCCT